MISLLLLRLILATKDELVYCYTDQHCEEERTIFYKDREDPMEEAEEFKERHKQLKKKCERLLGQTTEAHRRQLF